MKSCLRMEHLESCQTGQILTVLWGWDCWGALNLSAPPLGARLQSHGSHDFRSIAFQCYHRSGVKGFRIGQIKIPYSLLFIIKLGHFPWINVLWMTGSVSLIYRVLKIWFWQSFPVFSLHIWKNRFSEVLTSPFQKCYSNSFLHLSKCSF